MGESTFDVAIVGGGISGLSFAYHAARANLCCLVLEREARAGGCIHTVRTDGGFWYELGAHTLYNSYSAVLDMIVGLGLQGELLQRQKLPYRLLVERQIRTVSSQLAKIELLLSIWRAFTLRKPGRTVADYYGRLIGARNWKRVGSPLLSGVPLQRVDDLPAEMLFKRRPRRKEFPRSFTLANGLTSLVDGLVRRPGITLQTKATVTKVARGDAGFAIVTAEGTTHVARKLVLAAGPDVAARLLAPLDDAAAGALGRIAMAAVDSTGIVLAADAVTLPRLAGLIAVDDAFFSAVSRDVVPDPSRRALAFHFRAGLSLDQRLARIATVTGARRDAFLTVSEHPVLLPSPTLGHGEIVQALDRSIAGSGLYVTGNYFGGLAIEECVLRSVAEVGRLLNESR